jgi:hypothetical protein
MFFRILLSSFVAVIALALVGCGSGNSGSSGPPPPPPPPATFTLSLTPSTINLPQNATENVQIQPVAQNGFSGSVTITAKGLPSGVTVAPASLVLSVGDTGALSFTATSNATTGNAQPSLNGVSGSQQASATLGLTVIQMATPIAMPFTTVGGGVLKAFYDESRQLLFAGNLYLNEVDVLSGVDLSLQARIPIAQPFGIDQMSDGNTLVVGTMTQGFYTINESTLAVTRYLAPNFSQAASVTVLPTPIAMANGIVLFIGKDINEDTDDVFITSGQYIIEWDSTTGVFSSSMYFPDVSYPVSDLKRSADHNWAVFAADKLYIYSSATDNFVSSINPVNAAPNGVRNVAVNPNGTQLAVVSGDSVSFYDGAFNALGTANTSTGIFPYQWNAQYSADGSLLYWELNGTQAEGSVVDVLSTTTFTEVGDVTSDYGSQPQYPYLLWVDGRQQAFLGAVGGIGLLDCSTLRTGPAAGLGFGGVSPPAIPLNQSVSVTYESGAFALGTSIIVNGQLAPVESDNPNNNPIVFQVPPSSVAGPVNLVFTQLDGETLIEPQGFSYGVDVAAATSSLVPPIGNPTIGVFGFGMLNGPSTPPNVTVGGQTVTNVAVNPSANNVLQELLLQLPNGSPGPANIVATGNNGTGTLNSAVTYIPSASIIPASGLLQLLYDSHRSLLYALQSTQIQVLNPTSLQWQTPLLPGGTGGTQYVSITMTPDGSEMLVLDTMANTLTVFNPDDPSQSVVKVLAPLNGSTLQSVAATNTGKAFIGRFNAASIEFDLTSNTYKVLGNTLAQFAATADGSHMAGVDLTDTSGEIATWNSANDSFKAHGFDGVIWSDLAISPNGDVFAALEGNVGSAGIAAGFFNEGLQFMNATVYPDLAPPDQPFSIGATFSASGLTLLSPLGDSIDLFSTQSATLQNRLLMPELLPMGNASSGAIALDPNQQTIYAISASGLTVVTLPSVVDQITPFPWRRVAKASHSLPFAAKMPRRGTLAVQHH